VLERPRVDAHGGSAPASKELEGPGEAGLGLPVAQRIVEQHGGRLLARNRHGGGAEVALDLPLRGGLSRALP
jgi:signal transduction histidine kinase